MSTNAVEIHNVSYTYDQKKALSNVSFNVKTGSFTALLGLNGAGKTTLFSLLTGLFQLQQGSITIFEHSITKQACSALKHIGVVFQDRTLDLDLTVLQNFYYHTRLHGFSKKDSEGLIEEELANFDLKTLAMKKIRTLSGGQIRTVEIARAMLHKPNLLLLDEPTVGLDLFHREQIVERLHQISQQKSIGVLYATHLIDEIYKLDDVLLLDHGKLLASDSLEKLVYHSQTSNLGDAFKKILSENQS